MIETKLAKIEKRLVIGEKITAKHTQWLKELSESVERLNEVIILSERLTTDRTEQKPQTINLVYDKDYLPESD